MRDCSRICASCLQFVKMSKVAGSRKRKVTNRTINEKYKILKEVDKGETVHL